MTNTGDFRRYSYSSDTSYALEYFNAGRQSAAPKHREEKKRRLTVHENGERKTRTQLVSEQKASAVKAVKVMIISLVVMGMLFSVLYTYAAKNELYHEISSLETELAVAESENTRINSELDSLVSMSMIDQYAVEELGMTKVQSNQIMYIDSSQYREERAAAALLQLESEQ